MFQETKKTRSILQRAFIYQHLFNTTMKTQFFYKIKFDLKAHMNKIFFDIYIILFKLSEEECIVYTQYSVQYTVQIQFLRNTLWHQKVKEGISLYNSTFL